MGSEIAAKATFEAIRYAQCWEDADILLEALNIQPGDHCLSIASAGDNTLSLLLGDPARVIALDLSAAQLACLALRIAAYQSLDHGELLQLIGVHRCPDRASLYQRCRPLVESEARSYWDAHPELIARGIGTVGKFEHYFWLFRTKVLPLVHSRKVIEALFEPKSPEERAVFYRERWDTWRWRMMFRVFFSRTVMGQLGRDPSFFTYVEGNVADRISARTHYALTVLDPSVNPYLQWILLGTFRTALPLALREEHFDTIRTRVNRVSWQRIALEDYLDSAPDHSIDRFNLSDLFEYLAEANYHALLQSMIRTGRPHGRLVYWNMLVPRRRPESMTGSLVPLPELASDLFAQDKAFFYSALIVEELTGR